ncbi:hypothetical protein CGLO_10569 [Colletotrichum gloeosporioides Cg-14]|nr:hypothetical protein CGLO_10569 [Colletotrichum gloeosporioides Cg-14]
MVECIF